MSRTYKDKSYKYGGQEHWGGNSIKLVKKEFRNHRHLLKKLITRPPLGYIRKFLSDIWNWD